MSEFEYLALAAAAKKRRGGQTNAIEQAGIGVNQGLANMAGLPVDLMTGALNMGVRGVNSVAGTEIPEITDPVGGSGQLNRARRQVLPDTEPQTTGQRYARRVGQEVGAAAIPGGAAARSVQAPLKAMGGVATSATMAGLGGQTAREINPDSDMLDLMLSMSGGLTPVAASYIARKGPQAPTMDELRERQASAYDRVDSSPSRLTPNSTEALKEAVRARSARDTMDPVLAPKASRTADIIGGMENPTIREVEKSRRLTSRVAGNADPTESGLGMGMKEEITQHLDSLTPDDVTGGDPAATVAALREGRDVTRRIKKSEQIAEALTKGERRAATSGTGGNEVNAIRQNIRSILDNPKKRAGFTPEELEAMEGIARGTPAQNALRMAGRFSPTAGALPAMAGGGAVGALGPLGAAPSALGFLAKGGAEALTQRDIERLQQLIRNGAPLDPKRMSESESSALKALLAARLANVGGGTQ